jgi:hypothetical protein
VQPSTRQRARRRETSFFIGSFILSENIGFDTDITHVRTDAIFYS